MRRLVVMALCLSLLGSGIVPAYAEELAAPTAEMSESAQVQETAPAVSETEHTDAESTTTPLLAVPTDPIEATSTPSVEPQAPPEAPVSDIELIVKLKDGASSEAVATEEQAVVTEDLVTDDTVIMTTATSESAQEAADRLEDNPAVAYAEPNYARSVGAINSDDTYRALLWGLDNTGQSVNSTVGTVDADIDAPEAWQLSLGTSTVVAVIDSGVLYTHPELAGNMWDGSTCVSETGAVLGNCNHGYDFTDNDTSPLPVIPFVTQADHGTHVAGIIAASMNNATGTIGVAPQAKIMALRFALDVASEVKAIDFARENGAKIINASYGGTGYSQAEYDAIARFRDAGGIFIAAAGNDGTSNDTAPTYPASYDLSNIVSVAATDQDDALADFSSYGATTVDLAAPGTNILSTVTTDSIDFRYGYKSGTSMATPMVAGAVALAHSLYPTATVAEIKDALMESGDALPTLSGKTISGKRLNAYTMLVALGADTTPPVITLTGSATVSQQVGTTYTEEGATASDTHDGTVTVTIGGDTVDTATAGTYHVTYDATDTAGNHAVQVVRTVTITAVSSGGGGGGGGSSSSSSSHRRSGGGGGGGTSKISNPARPLLTNTSTSVPLTTPAPAYSFLRPLTVGTQGSDVSELQSLLAKLGLFSGISTGYYGDVTSSAVRSFQSAHGLPVTGVADTATLAALNQNVPTAPAPAITNSTALQAQIAGLLVLLQTLQAKLAAQLAH